jgi:hypothetical protein
MCDPIKFKGKYLGQKDRNIQILGIIALIKTTFNGNYLYIGYFVLNILLIKPAYYFIYTDMCFSWKRTNKYYFGRSFYNYRWAVVVLPFASVEMFGAKCQAPNFDAAEMRAEEGG